MLSDREINACLAGASAGIATTAVCSPLDVAKIRAQATRRAPRAPYDAVKSIWKAEGFRGLFLGLSPALLTVPIFWATCTCSVFHIDPQLLAPVLPGLRTVPRTHTIRASC